jgi:hypothetical protein
MMMVVVVVVAAVMMMMMMVVMTNETLQNKNVLHTVSTFARAHFLRKCIWWFAAQSASIALFRENGAVVEQQQHQTTKDGAVATPQQRCP